MVLTAMKKEIEAFDRHNGNKDFSQRELLKYLIIKSDKAEDRHIDLQKWMDNKLSEVHEKINTQFSGINERIGEVHKTLGTRFEKCSGKFISKGDFWKVIIVLVLGLVATGVFNYLNH